MLPFFVNMALAQCAAIQDRFVPDGEMPRL
jgi:hypothetical protein